MDLLPIIDWNFFHQELKGYVYKRVKDRALAEDIVQDVFLKVHAKVGQLNEKEKLNQWIYQITRNAIVDHFRKQSRNLNPRDIDRENDDVNFNECVARSLQKLLLTLPGKYREALELSTLQNFSQTEMAERLGISYSGMKSRVQRARQMLKNKLDETLIVQTDLYGNAVVCAAKHSNCCQ